jgi:hypothetical protein
MYFMLAESSDQRLALSHFHCRLSAADVGHAMFAGGSNDYLLNLESEGRMQDLRFIGTGAYERRPFDGVPVVDRLSGTRDCEKMIAIDENHLTIVKPCEPQR